MLVLTMFGVVATIAVRVFINFDIVNRDNGRLADTIDVFQEITFMSSLITNILGTGIISLKAWRYRRWIVADLEHVVNKRTKSERVLAVLVESGVFYILSGAVMVASSLIRLPRSHVILESLYSQAAIHLAGIYPLIVVVLVNREATMDKTLFNSTLPVVITDLQQASSHSRAAARQAAKSTTPTGMASLQLAAAHRPRPSHTARGSSSLRSSSSRDTLASSSSLEPDAV